MKAKRATFDLLDGLPFDRDFPLTRLRDNVGELIDRPNIYCATIARYLREYRALRGVKVRNTSKAKSLYRKER